MDLQASISSALPWAPVPTSATLADWERLMRRAGAALQMQQWRMALGYQRQALAVALGIAHQPPAGREDDCVAALVVSHLNLADLSQEAAAPGESARLLCHAHATLLAWMADPTATPALQQAAWRHSRETHAALLRHVAQHGPQADVVRLLQASHPIPTRARIELPWALWPTHTPSLRCDASPSHFSSLLRRPLCPTNCPHCPMPTTLWSRMWMPAPWRSTTRVTTRPTSTT